MTDLILDDIKRTYNTHVNSIDGRTDRRERQKIVDQFNKEKVQEIKEQNKIDLEQIPKRISYLEKISEINRVKNGSIDNIINFLKNLHYLKIEKVRGGHFGAEYYLPRLVVSNV